MLTNEQKVRIATREKGFQDVETIGVIMRAVRVKSLEKAEEQSLLEKIRDGALGFILISFRRHRMPLIWFNALEIISSLTWVMAAPLKTYALLQNKT